MITKQRLITWVENKRLNIIQGYTKEDFEYEQQPKYYIEHNTHLHVDGSRHKAIYLASTEDAKLCAELIEKGRVTG